MKAWIDAGLRSALLALPDALGAGMKAGLLVLFVWYVWEFAAASGFVARVVIGIVAAVAVVRLAAAFIGGARQSGHTAVTPAVAGPQRPSLMALVLLVAIPVALVAAIDRFAAPESSKHMLNGTLLQTTLSVLHSVQD